VNDPETNFLFQDQEGATVRGNFSMFATSIDAGRASAGHFRRPSATRRTRPHRTAF